MKLQALGVIFVIIIVPLILVLSYYLSLQIKTITNQNKYDSALLAATHDAMSSFEINTANEDLSTVSDSLRTIIEASTNVFINTLATNMGISNASKSYLEPYLPAMLYTLYDGYYIYSPTKVPEMLTTTKGVAVTVGDKGVSGRSGNYTYVEEYNTDGSVVDPTVEEGETERQKYALYDQALMKDEYGQQLYLTGSSSVSEYESDGKATKTTTNVTANVDEAKKTTKNVLKTYMPYSAKYRQGNKEFTIIYTLDNYVTVEGNIEYDTGNKVYFSKSGYLIPTADAEGNSIMKVYFNTYDASHNKTRTGENQLLNFNQADAKKYIEDGNSVTLVLKDTKGNDIVIESGLEPKMKTVVNGGNSVDKLFTYIYTDTIRINNPANPAELIDDIQYYNYEELEKRVVNLNARYDLAHEYIKNSYVGIETTEAQLNELADALIRDGVLPIGAHIGSGGTSLDQIITLLTAKLNEIQYALDNASAIDYYVESYIFSKWIQDNLGDIEEKSLVEVIGVTGEQIRTKVGSEDAIYDFSTKTTHIFDVNGETKEGTYEIAIDSPFYTHKLNVIRNSIQYNLNLAMSTYNAITAIPYDYEMPIMSGEEWEKILTNVSLVTFMQGYNCGFKAYNNYKIVTSSNNELVISPLDIFYVPIEGFNDTQTIYHRIDCPDMYNSDDGSRRYLSFSSKEVKYDKLEIKKFGSYKYDHKNLADYKCVTDNNYDDIDIFNIYNRSNYDSLDAGKINNLQKAFYTAVGKERNNLYKMNAIAISQGYEIIYTKGQGNGFGISSALPLKYIKSIQITIDPLRFNGTPESVINFKTYLNDSTVESNLLTSSTSSVYTINYSADKMTISLDIAPNNRSERVSLGILKFKNEAISTNLVHENGSAVIDNDITDVIKNKALSVRVVYK